MGEGCTLCIPHGQRSERAWARSIYERITMAGIVRYRETDDGDYVFSEARCSDCIDFTPNWVETAGVGWCAGDREAVAGDENLVCSYCGYAVYPDAVVTEEPTVRYAEGFAFVNVYELDRIYGGPEEGGWYYDAGRLVLSRQVPSVDAQRIAEELREEYPNTGKRYSVIYAGGDYTVNVEDEPGQDFPEYTPHYE